VGYFTATLDDQGALKKDLTYDGLHPNDAGYNLIMTLAQTAVDQALESQDAICLSRSSGAAARAQRQL
jgi:lysophospholipase L1-like esterase